jgi:hypothetical protein
MRTRASLHADQARRQVREEWGDLFTPQLLSKYRFAALINGMQLKHVLRQINADRCNLHLDAPIRFKWLLDTSTLAHRCRYGWGRPSHCFWPR